MDDDDLIIQNPDFSIQNSTLLLSILRQHGRHSLAFSIVQPGMSYFGDQDRGLVAYRKRMGQVIVLGDPLCDLLQKATFLEDFLRAHPAAFFMQVSQDTADILRGFGYRATPVGVENQIDTSTYSLDGKRKRDIRHYRNRALKAGVTVRELPDTVGTREHLRPVSDAWLPLKSWFTHELEFLARPFQMQPEPDARIFAAYIDDAPAGFVVLDPMYEAGRVRGYCVSILRHYPDSPEGTCDYINLCVLDQLCRESVPMLSLGVSPFHRMQEYAQKMGHGAWPVYFTFRALDRWGSPIYHFRGLSFHKSRYRAQETPVYACVRSPWGVLPLYASARACRML